MEGLLVLVLIVKVGVLFFRIASLFDDTPDYEAMSYSEPINADHPWDNA